MNRLAGILTTLLLTVTELAAAAVWSDGVFVVWMPSISVSLPLRRSSGPAR